MKTCPQCNAKNLNSAEECEECGSSLQADTTVPYDPEIRRNNDNVDGAVNMESEKMVPVKPWGLIITLIVAVISFLYLVGGVLNRVDTIGEGAAQLGRFAGQFAFAGALFVAIIILLVLAVKGFKNPTMVPESSFYDPKLAKDLYSEAYALWDQRKEKELIEVYAKLIVECPDSQEVEWAQKHFKVNESELYAMVRKLRSDKQINRHNEN